MERESPRPNGGGSRRRMSSGSPTIEPKMAHAHGETVDLRAAKATRALTRSCENRLLPQTNDDALLYPFRLALLLSYSCHSPFTVSSLRASNGCQRPPGNEPEASSKTHTSGISGAGASLVK